jgi:glycosyltransferase involved in cell wall biosynthesis
MIQLNFLVSIIVRTNQEERLPLFKNALLSIISNDYRPIEIVIVVQSEKEDFIQKIQDVSQGFTDEQTQIKLVINNTSQDERARNLNLGINAAKGRYIGFLDDDDIIYKNHISSLIEEIDTSELASWAYSQVAMSICNLNNDKVNIMSLGYPFKKERFTFQEILKDNFIPIHSYLIDRSKYNPDFIYFDESFPVLEDYEFIIRLIHCSKPTFINEVTCEYRFYVEHSDSNTDVYSILDYRESKNAHIWLETGERIEKIKKKLYPEYSSGLISSNKRKFLLSSFPALNIIKKQFPRLWKSIKYIASLTRLI